MAVQHEVGAAIKRGAEAVLDLISIGINWAVDQYVALFDLSPIALLIAIGLIILIFGVLSRRWRYEYLWGIVSLVVTIFIVGGVGWVVGWVARLILASLPT